MELSPPCTCLLRPNNLHSNFLKNVIAPFYLEIPGSNYDMVSIISNIFCSALQRKPLI